MDGYKQWLPQSAKQTLPADARLGFFWQRTSEQILKQLISQLR